MKEQVNSKKIFRYIYVWIHIYLSDVHCIFLTGKLICWEIICGFLSTGTWRYSSIIDFLLLPAHTPLHHVSLLLIILFHCFGYVCIVFFLPCTLTYTNIQSHSIAVQFATMILNHYGSSHINISLLLAPKPSVVLLHPVNFRKKLILRVCQPCSAGMMSNLLLARWVTIWKF